MLHIIREEGRCDDIVVKFGLENQLLAFPKYLYPKTLYREVVRGVHIDRLKIKVETYIPLKTLEGLTYFQHHVEVYEIPRENDLEVERTCFLKRVSEQWKEYFVHYHLMDADQIMRITRGEDINTQIYDHLHAAGSIHAERIFSVRNPRVMDLITRDAFQSPPEPMLSSNHQNTVQEEDQELDQQAQDILDGLD